MAMGRVDVGFCPPQTQIHKVRVSSYPSQFSTGTKIKNSYPTGFGYPHLTIPPYEFELHFDIFLLIIELKLENYFSTTICIQRK
jgi:hypothetical protein